MRVEPWDGSDPWADEPPCAICAIEAVELWCRSVLPKALAATAPDDPEHVEGLRMRNTVEGTLAILRGLGRANR